MRRTARAALILAALGVALDCTAGTGSAAFSVNIQLTVAGGAPGPVPPGATGTCVSQTLSQENGAIVRVACDTGQFVSISPIPGARFVGTHGGAYSYHFGSSLGGVNLAGFGQFANGAGSVTSFRVFDATETDGLLGMLISF